AKVAGVSVDATGVRVKRCGRHGAEVADWVREVHMIQQIEDLGAQLEILRLAILESLNYGEVDIRLRWSTQNVAADVAKVGSRRTRTRRAIRTRYHLARQNNRPHKSERIEIVTRR